MRIDSARITGSIRGSQAFAQLSGSFTGSLLGTSSWAENAITASYALNAGSSFPYTGSADISGSFSVDGPSVLDGVTVGGHIVPETAGEYNLGSPSASFQHLYLSTASLHFVEADGTIIETLSATAEGISGSFVGDGSGITGVVSASYAVSASSIEARDVENLDSFLQAQEFLKSADSASFFVSASTNSGTDGRITFTNGDGTTESVVLDSVATASYVAGSDVDGEVDSAATASYVAASNVDGNVATASFALTASYVAGMTVETASYVTASNVHGPHGGNSVISSSHAVTASYVAGANVDGEVASATSASHALTASFVSSDFTIPTASHALTASHVITSSHSITTVTADSASYATTASHALEAVSASHALRADAADSVHFDNVTNKPTLYSSSANLVAALEGQNLNLNVLSASIFHEVYTTQSINKGSGSFAFGDTLDDTHTFTGSVNITGSLTINGEELSVESASYATTASHALEAVSASHALRADDADSATSASYATTASHALVAVSASHADNASNANNATSASIADTASYIAAADIDGNVATASFALTASHLLDMNIESASFATTASYAHTASVVSNPGVRVHNFSAVTSTTFTHNIGRTEVFVQCYDNSGANTQMIIPSEIILDSANALTVEFAETTTGYLVVLG